MKGGLGLHLSIRSDMTATESTPKNLKNQKTFFEIFDPYGVPQGGPVTRLRGGKSKNRLGSLKYIVKRILHA